MRFLLILLPLLIFGNTKGYCLSSDSMIAIKNNLRILPFAGIVFTSSEEPKVANPFANSEEYGAWQSGIGVEWVHFKKAINIGLGAAFYYRYYRYQYGWNDDLERYSNKIYSIVEINNNSKRELMTFDLQVGVMEGSLSSKYTFDLYYEDYRA